MVRPIRAALVGGFSVALLVVAMFMVRPVPDSVVGLFGGAVGIERVGGVEIKYRPPPGLASFPLRGVAGNSVRPCSAAPCDVLVLDYLHVDADAIPELVDVLVNGGLEMHEVLETGFARELVPFAAPGVELEVDTWRADAGGERHEEPYLRAHERRDLERTIERAAAGGVKPPPGSEIQFEQITVRRASNNVETLWRTYLLASEVLLDGLDVRSARRDFNPYNQRPVVIVDLTGASCAEAAPLDSSSVALFQPSLALRDPECDRGADTTNGTKKFCELSRRLVGRKIANVFGDRIRSAPIINGPICEGRLELSMGGDGDAEQEADALASALDRGAVPRGGLIENARWLPAADVRVAEWLGRALFGVVAGLGFGLLCWLVVRTSRPSWRTKSPRASGEFPFGRLFVTLAGPSALLIGSNFALPGINDIELEHYVMRGTVSIDSSIIALGVMPILIAFAVVELVALIVPRWRWRRHDPLGRIRLRQATAVLAVGFALMQGYLAAKHMEALSSYGAEVVVDSGRRFELITMVTLAAGTMLLTLLAGIISVHGLANGYAVILVSDWLLELGRPLLFEVHANAYSEWFDRTRIIGIALLAVMMFFTWCALRWRIRGGERELPLRVPSSGVMGLSDSGGLAAIVAALSSLGVAGSLSTWIDSTRASLWISIACVVPFAVLWSWLFARPSLLARASMQAGAAPPSRSTWWRATLISAGLIAAVSALGWIAQTTDAWNIYLRNASHTLANQHASALADPVLAMIATAVLVDALDGARAHRERLVPVAMLHQIQTTGVVERVLGAASIRFHIQAANVRTLFAFFGPWAPAIVMVPEASAAEALEKLDGALREPRARVPRAQIATS